MTNEILTGIKLFPQEGSNDRHIGYIIDGEGIYMGLWGLREIKLSEGKKQRLICSDLNVSVHAFASINDLTNQGGRPFIGTFSEATKEVTNRSGNRFEMPVRSYENTLCERLLSGAYGGEWVVPTKEMLVESKYKGRIEHTMHDLRKIGDFRGTLETEVRDDAVHPLVPYWSCYSINHENLLRVAVVNMSLDGGWGYDDSRSSRRCRPVRFRSGNFSFG